MKKQKVIAGIIAECKKQGLKMPEQQAYVIATVEHETNSTFRPVREAYWLSERWRRKNLRYWPFYGRGYVQITWKRNYRKFGKLLNLDLVGNPDLALQPSTALFILVYGFKWGIFTGRKLKKYVRPGHVDFRKARRCINGTDKAKKIARMAKKRMVLHGR